MFSCTRFEDELIIMPEKHKKGCNRILTESMNGYLAKQISELKEKEIIERTGFDKTGYRKIVTKK